MRRIFKNGSKIKIQSNPDCIREKAQCSVLRVKEVLKFGQLQMSVS